jgi:hypothetical protein
MDNRFEPARLSEWLRGIATTEDEVDGLPRARSCGDLQRVSDGVFERHRAARRKGHGDGTIIEDRTGGANAAVVARPVGKRQWCTDCLTQDLGGAEQPDRLFGPRLCAGNRRQLL